MSYVDAGGVLKRCDYGAQPSIIINLSFDLVQMTFEIAKLPVNIMVKFHVDVILGVLSVLR